VATQLRAAGYATGIFGKWHLGKHPDSNPVHHGFDIFRGLTCGCGDYFSHLDREGHADWWHNTQQVSEQGYTTEVLTEHAVQFIREHKDQPFFLYVPHLAIHFPWQAPEDRMLGVRKPGVDFSSSEPGPQSKLGPHSPEEIPSVVIRMIESLDQSVGRICETLRQQGLAENTLVVFTSDNGGYLGYGDSYRHGVSSNGVLRGQKGDVYEGGHRVPLILEWPGRIEPGTVATQTVLTMDLSPTFLDIAGIRHPDSQSRIPFDGRSMLPLSSVSNSDSERTLFWRHGGIRGKKAVRRGPWKLVIPTPGATPELYQLESDISETRSVADDHPEVAATLLSALSEWERSLLHNPKP
jgi:arylsulfatase A-like enzyme